MLAPWIIRPKNRQDARRADTTEDDDFDDNEEEEVAPKEGDNEYLIVDGTLRVSDHSLDMGGFASILHTIKKNKELLELNLSGCNISRGDEIAEMVQNAPNLQRLVLEWNNLGLARSGIAALASAIATSRTLKTVDLRSNRIGPCTAATLAHAFRNSSSLTTLGT